VDDRYSGQIRFHDGEDEVRLDGPSVPRRKWTEGARRLGCHTCSERLSESFRQQESRHGSVSFESPSAGGSANIAKYYLDEGKSRLQEEAFDRASKNKKFIEEQIGKTVDALTRDRLYSLYGLEVEREMMARNREQFGSGLSTPQDPGPKSEATEGNGGHSRFLNSAVISSLIILSLKKKSSTSKSS